MKKACQSGRRCSSGFIRCCVIDGAEGDSKRGIGLFFNVGATGGNPNPVQYSYMMGMVGRAAISLCRYFARLGFGIDHEDAVEMYYTAALAAWLSVSPHLQVINSGLSKVLDQNNGLKNLETSVEASLRMTIQC